MTHKKKHRRHVRPTIPVQWKKDDPDGKARFERACEHIGGKPVTVARALCDAWTQLVMSGDSDIERAAKIVANRGVVKKK